MEGFIAVNGKVTAPEAALIPALDRGLLYGDGVFEVFVAFGTQILDVERHFDRLRASAEALEFTIPWSNAEMAFELSDLVSRVPSAKKYIRLAVTRGSGLSLKLPAGAVPNRYVYCLPAAQEAPRIYRDGLSLRRLIKVGGARGAAPKTGNYLASVMGLAKAQKEGFDEILWTNSEGEVTEAATANIFFLSRVGDNVAFLTPPAQSGILLGITRSTLIELMQNAGIPVQEQTIFVDELPRFDEAFVCSTVRGLVPVSTIDKHKLHTARPGSVFRHIERLYMTWVETQLGYRVDWGTGQPI